MWHCVVHTTANWESSIESRHQPHKLLSHTFLRPGQAIILDLSTYCIVILRSTPLKTAPHVTTLFKTGAACLAERGLHLVVHCCILMARKVQSSSTRHNHCSARSCTAAIGTSSCCCCCCCRCARCRSAAAVAASSSACCARPTCRPCYCCCCPAPTRCCCT